MLCLQHDGRVRRHVALFLGLLVDHAADHHADDLVHRHLGGVHRADVLAVAHDGDAVGDLLELAHAVRYVDDAHAARLQIADEAEQLLDLAFGQRRGRLVHDEYARVVVGEGLGDLHHLLARPRSACRRWWWGSMSMERLGKSSAAIWFCLRLLSSMPFIGSRPMKMFSATRQVFHQVQFLMDDGDAQRLRVARVVDLYGLAVEKDLARVHLVDAGEHLHHRRFSRRRSRPPARAPRRS